jgi:hypothetical protein
VTSAGPVDLETSAIVDIDTSTVSEADRHQERAASWPHGQRQGRLIIAGSRRIQAPNLAAIVAHLLEVALPAVGVYWRPHVIISGHARGPDLAGEEYARSHGIECRIFHARWQVHGKGAGPIRNAQMAEAANRWGDGALLALWDGKSEGTTDMIVRARNAGLPTVVATINAPRPPRARRKDPIGL